MRTILKALISAGTFVVALTVLSGSAHGGGALQARGSTFMIDGHAIPPSHYRGELQQFVRQSELFILPQELRDNRFLVLVRRPSRTLEMHRCGAGLEDYLLLLRYSGDALTLLDKISLQSCERSVTLDAPDASQPNEIFSALHLEGDELRFSVVAPTPSGDIGLPQKKRYLLTKDRFFPAGY